LKVIYMRSGLIGSPGKNNENDYQTIGLSIFRREIGVGLRPEQSGMRELKSEKRHKNWGDVVSGGGTIWEAVSSAQSLDIRAGQD